MKPRGLDVCRRTLCLVLASAARQLYPDLRSSWDTVLAMGTTTLESGDENIVIDLERLEQRMREIIEADANYIPLCFMKSARAVP